MSFEKQAKAIEARAGQLFNERHPHATQSFVTDPRCCAVIEAVLEHVHHDDGKASVYVPVSAAHACPHGVCGGKCCPLPPADAVEEAARSMLQVQDVFPGAQPQALAWQDMGNGDWLLVGLPLGIGAAVYAPDEEQPEHSYEIGRGEDVLAQGLAPKVENARLQCMRALARTFARIAQVAEFTATALSREVL